MVIPSFLKSKVYVNFCDDAEYSKNFKKLVCQIHDTSRVSIVVPDSVVEKQPKKVNGPKNRSDMATNRISVLNQAYDFAYNELGFTQQESKKFSEDWVSKYLEIDFRIFRKAFRFFSSLDFSQPASFYCSMEWIKSFSDRDLKEYRLYYDFIRDETSLSRSDSSDFTFECLDCFGREELKAFKTGFRCAKENLKLDDSRAIKYAITNIIYSE